MTASQQVATIDDISEANAPAIYVKGGLLQFLEAVKVEVTAEVPDLTTKKGRDRIASLAAKVSKSKVAVEKPGREYLARLKEMPKEVEAELREFVRSMDELRDATRAPLTQWEEAEAARVAALRSGVESMRDLAACLEGLGSDDIKARLAKVTAIALGPQWEEYETEAARAKDDAVQTLIAARDTREHHEAELAAIAKFQAEQAEREQKEREERIAREAAEQAKLEAEQRAQAERDAAAKREAELVEKAAQAQRQADQDKRDAAAAAEQARLNAELAEQRRIAAEKQAEIDRVAAEQRQAEAVERAAQAERQRQADEQARVEAEAKAREADRAHKTKVNRQAVAAFVSGGMTEEAAKQAVTLIAKRQIPNIAIAY